MGNICLLKMFWGITRAINHVTPKPIAISGLSTTGCSRAHSAFKELIADIQDGSYPEPKHVVPIKGAEFETFLAQLGGQI
jgi:hypothetical protein